MEMYWGNGCRKRRASWLFCCCEWRLRYHKKPFLDGDSQCLEKTKEEAKEVTPHLRLIPKFCLSLKPLKPLVFSFFSFFLSFISPSLIALLSTLVLQFFKTNKTSCTFFSLSSSSSKLGASSWTVYPQRHVYPCETTICPDSNYYHAKLVEKREEACLN